MKIGVAATLLGLAAHRSSEKDDDYQDKEDDEKADCADPAAGGGGSGRGHFCDNATTGYPENVPQWRWNFPRLSFTRAWWLGEGKREGISAWVEKKLAPGEDPKFGSVVHAGLVLPRYAPGEYGAYRTSFIGSTRCCLRSSATHSCI